MPESRTIKTLSAVAAAALLALLPACGSNEVEGDKPLVERYTMCFDLDIEDHGTLFLEIDGKAIEATLTVEEGNNLIAGNTPLEGPGKRYTFPEVRNLLYTARFQGAPVPGGPCGDDPVSLAMSLSAKDLNAHFVGGLTAYCGEETYRGKPARIMRIAGDLVPENKGD